MGAGMGAGQAVGINSAPRLRKNARQLVVDVEKHRRDLSTVMVTTKIKTPWLELTWGCTVPAYVHVPVAYSDLVTAVAGTSQN